MKVPRPPPPRAHSFSPTKKRLSASEAARRLQQKIQADAEWGPFVAHWLQEGIGAEEIVHMLYLAEAYIRFKERGYSQHTSKALPAHGILKQKRGTEARFWPDALC